MMIKWKIIVTQCKVELKISLWKDFDIWKVPAQNSSQIMKQKRQIA